jgi:hypothetical protein
MAGVFGDLVDRVCELSIDIIVGASRGCFRPEFRPLRPLITSGCSAEFSES